MSNINPANINGSYPIAGQDNDSQGFRDNFTNIKSNLTYARNELEDLAAKVVVKAALNVNGSTVENDMNGTDFYNVRVKNVRQIIDAVAIDASDIASMSVTNGSVKQIETVGHPAFAIDLVDTGEQIDGFASIRIQIAAQEPSQVITFPITVTIGGEYIEGFDVLNKTLTLLNTDPTPESNPAYYWFELSTTDGWNTVTITDLNRNYPGTIAYATTAGTVTANAQPNITSVGTLTSLTMADQNVVSINGKISKASIADTSLDAAVAQSLPTGTPSNIGVAGDNAGKIKLDGDYIYVCTATFDGVTAIWKRAALSSF